MSSIKWIKLNVDMFDDEKIKIIQSMPEGDSLLIVWIKLITLAGKTNDGGYIYINENMAYTDEMLSVIMNKPLNIIQLALGTFTRLGMIELDEKGIYLINFEKYQSIDKLEKIREQTRLRVAKHREKLKNDDVTLQVTQSNAIDIDIDKDIDKEYIKESKKKSFKKPTIEEIQDYCKERNNSINADAFYDFYESKNWYVGKNKMQNWKAAIRTWEQRDNKTTKKQKEDEVIKRFLNEEE